MDHSMIQVTIVPTGTTDDELLRALGELNEQRVEEALSPQATEFQAAGVKSGLTLAISIAGLALTSVSTLVSVLAYWRAGKERMSVTLKRGDVVYKLDNASPARLLEIAEAVETEPAPSSALVVEVSRHVGNGQ